MKYKIGRDNVERCYYIYLIEDTLIKRYAGPFKTWGAAFKFKIEYIK